MSTTSFKTFSVLASLSIVISGLFLVVAGIVFRLLATSPASLERATPIQWLWFVGGGVFVILGVFSLGAASAHRDRPRCPHCNEPVDVRMQTLGRLRLDKLPPQE